MERNTSFPSFFSTCTDMIYIKFLYYVYILCFDICFIYFELILWLSVYMYFYKLDIIVQKSLENSITQSNLKNSLPETKIFRKKYNWLEIHFWGWWSYIVNWVMWYSYVHCAKGLEAITFVIKTWPLLLHSPRSVGDSFCCETRRVLPWMPHRAEGT